MGGLALYPNARGPQPNGPDHPMCQNETTSLPEGCPYGVIKSRRGGGDRMGMRIVDAGHAMH
jgi:hypothetical protein